MSLNSRLIFSHYRHHSAYNRSCFGGLSSVAMLLALVVLGFIGIRFGQVYFNHATLVNEIKDTARNGLINKSYDIAMRIPGMVRSSGGEVEDSQISVNYSIDFDAVSVSFPYKRNIDLIMLNQPWNLKVDFAVEAPQAVESVNKAVDGINSGMNQYQNKIDEQYKK